MKFDDRQILLNFQKFETLVSDYEKSTGDKLTDLFKKNLMLTQSSGKLHDHLCLMNSTTMIMETKKKLIGVIVHLNLRQRQSQ